MLLLIYRVINRDFGSDQEKYSPVATSPFQLGNIEGKLIYTSSKHPFIIFFISQFIFVKT